MQFGNRVPLLRMEQGKRFSLVAVFILLELIAVSGAGAVDVYLNLKSEGARKVVMAIPKFSTESDSPAYRELAERSLSTLMRDLEVSGIFDLVDISAFYSSAGAKEGDINFNQWFLVGMQALTVGSIKADGESLEFYGWLYDVPMGKLIVGKSYRGELNDLDRVVHKWADEIVFRYTGQYGIAQTQIAAVAPGKEGKELIVMDYDGSHQRMLTSNRSLNLNPQFAPDNKQIVYTSYLAGNPDLHILSVETGKSVRVTKDSLNITPCYSPDGSKIAFSRGVDGNPEIFIMDAGSRALQRLTVSPGVDSSPTWAPNSGEIAFTSDRAGHPQIYIMNSGGGDVRRLTNIGDYNDAADWSPKGDLIAFQSQLGGEFQICTIAPDGSQYTQWTSGSGSNECPSWAPDGRHLVFSSTRDGGSQLFSLDILTGRVVKLTNGSGRFVSPAWSH